MKKLCFTTFLLLLVAMCVNGQGEWSMIHPYPSINYLRDIHFVSDNEGWVVGADGVILYTEDGGHIWEEQLNNPDESYWSVFFIDEYEGWVCGWSRIYHTVDKGRNWESQNFPYVMGDLTDVYFVNKDTGFIAGTYKTILRTTDGGENWEKLSNTIWGDIWLEKIHFYDALRGCSVGDSAMNDGYILATEDGGTTWHSRSFTECGAILDVEYINDSTIWTCGRSGCVLKSTDNGYTWTDKYHELDYLEDIHFFTDSNVMLLDWPAAHFSFDAGESWDSTKYISEGSSIYSFMGWEENKGVGAGYHGSIVKTLDGGENWEQLDTTLKVGFYQLGFADAFRGFGIYSLYSTSGALVRTWDGGHSWYIDTVFEEIPPYLIHVDGQLVAMLNENFELARSYDGGDSWEFKSVPVAEQYTAIQFTDMHNGMLCGKNGAFCITTDGGHTWAEKPTHVSDMLTSMQFLNEQEGFLIDETTRRVMRTENAGDSWDGYSMYNGSDKCTPVYLQFQSDIFGYVCTEEGVIFKTTDGGNTWLPLHDFEYGNERVKVCFTSKNEGWYITNRLFHSMDGGLSWSDHIQFGQGTADIRSIFFLDQNTGWLGGTYGMIARYSGTVKIEDNLRPGFDISLSPNPASESILIKASGEAPEAAFIEIHDITGKTVRQENIAIEKLGHTLNIADLQAGTYIISFQASGPKIYKKFIKN